MFEFNTRNTIEKSPKHHLFPSNCCSEFTVCTIQWLKLFDDRLKPLVWTLNFNLSVLILLLNYRGKKFHSVCELKWDSPLRSHTIPSGMYTFYSEQRISFEKWTIFYNLYWSHNVYKDCPFLWNDCEVVYGRLSKYLGYHHNNHQQIVECNVNSPGASDMI